MNKDIIINENNFKKFSKRLLKEINVLTSKSTESEPFKLSDSQNLLSRVFTKKDYNEMKKLLEFGITTKTNTTNIQKEELESLDSFSNNFHREMLKFIKDKDINVIILDIKNGEFSKYELHYEYDGLNQTVDKSGRSPLYNYEKENIENIDRDYAQRFCRTITNKCAESGAVFSINRDLDSYITINTDTARFLEYNEIENFDPFSKKNMNFLKLYVTSEKSKLNNTYRLSISKEDSFTLRRLR